jgi:hypothetical protein
MLNITGRMDLTCRTDDRSVTDTSDRTRQDQSSAVGMETTCAYGGSSFYNPNVTNLPSGSGMTTSMDITCAVGNSRMGPSASSGLRLTWAAPTRIDSEGEDGQTKQDDDDCDSASFDGGATATIKFRKEIHCCFSCIEIM